MKKNVKYKIGYKEEKILRIPVKGIERFASKNITQLEVTKRKPTGGRYI